MAKFRDDQTSFIAGEISPTALARTDLPAYRHGCKKLRNMIPLPSGGAYRRPGTKFQAFFNVTSYHAPRLIPFVASETEATMLVFTKQVAGNGLVGSIAPTDNTTSAVTTVGLPSAITGTHPYLASDLISGRYYDEWHEVQYAQSVDVMWLVHPNRKPQKIYRTAANTFRITEFDHDSSGNQLTSNSFKDIWPYLNQNTTAITLTVNNAAVGTGRTLTASSALFSSTHVGAVFKVHDGAGTYGCALVTAFTSSTVVTVQVITAFGDTAAHATWWESAWSDYQGWPRSVGFFQGRLLFGGTTKSPDSVWHSKTYDYNTMSVAALILVDQAGDGATTGPTGSQPFTLTFASPRLDLIQWIAAEKTLIVGTAGLEWLVDKADQTLGYGINNLEAVIGSHFGSTHLQPARAGSELIFAYQSEHELKALIFNLVQNAYNDESIQLLYDEFPYAETVAAGVGNRKFRGIAWDGTRKTLWAVDTAGNLRGMTRDRQLQITAWHSHQLGGFDSTKTGGQIAGNVDPIYYACAGSVVSVAVMPNPALGVDDVWLAVKRYVNGVYSFHIERILGENYPQSTAYTAPAAGNGNYLVDASIFNTNDYPLAETYVRGGFTHLVGETPVGTSFNTNGIFYTTGSAVSAAGNTTIQQTYPTGYASISTSTILGLGFDSILEPVRRDAGSQIGSAQGAIKRIHEITTRFYRTMHAKVGRDAASVIAINFREPDLAMGLSAELYTGDKLQKFPGTYDRDAYVYILCDRPLPFAVLSVVTEGMTSDGG